MLDAAFYSAGRKKLTLSSQFGKPQLWVHPGFLWVESLSSGSKKGAAPPSFPVASALGSGARPMRR
ncbi:hypothetical protein Pla175_37390 [Pirellulimonas nuda]|uniref:Uncharacterized protein n=1 Tax=Pirellulimonas nuda TaxID=2528009 RepID=A0A518DFT0_9BACT|nr:hypothetical protein Pla175_37390 [Pirellulimonas nuda]